MRILTLLIFCLAFSWSAFAQNQFESDTFNTSAGALTITFIGHGTLMMRLADGPVVYVDPVSTYADYATMPKADLILITHGHGDHLDPAAVKTLTTTGTITVVTQSLADQIPDDSVMLNGDSGTFKGLAVSAVPAYNIVHMRDTDMPYHPKGEGNGYVITFGDTRVYVAGDTENIPEMDNLENIDIAFLPMNLPYTMTPEMVADAARRIKPNVLYPYHFGDTNLSALTKLLDGSGIDVRLRKLE